MEFNFKAIGTISSCFKERFGIPRQPGLVPDARALLKMIYPFGQPDAMKELDGFSHIWVIFVFHASMRDSGKTTVRPPRLGGNKRAGVFATRSSFRPNAIGMSAIELEKITYEGKETYLHLKGVDILDGTPVLDIKPYLPYADSIIHAKSGFAPPPASSIIDVSFSPEAKHFCLKKEQENYPGLIKLIEEILKTDPRPAYYSLRPKKNSFGMKIHDIDVKWEIIDNIIYVTACKELK